MACSGWQRLIRPSDTYTDRTHSRIAHANTKYLELPLNVNSDKSHSTTQHQNIPPTLHLQSAAPDWACLRQQSPPRLSGLKLPQLAVWCFSRPRLPTSSTPHHTTPHQSAPTRPADKLNCRSAPGVRPAGPARPPSHFPPLPHPRHRQGPTLAVAPPADSQGSLHWAWL